MAWSYHVVLHPKADVLIESASWETNSRLTLLSDRIHFLFESNTVFSIARVHKTEEKKKEQKQFLSVSALKSPTGSLASNTSNFDICSLNALIPKKETIPPGSPERGWNCFVITASKPLNQASSISALLTFLTREFCTAKGQPSLSHSKHHRMLSNIQVRSLISTHEMPWVPSQSCIY